MRSRHDENQLHLAGCLRKLGWTVKFTTNVGEGFPDAICGRGGIDVKVEFKVDSQHPPETQLRITQVKFHDEWPGSPPYVVRNEVDCVELYEKERQRLREVLNES